MILTSGKGLNLISDLLLAIQSRIAMEFLLFSPNYPVLFIPSEDWFINT